MVFVENIVKAIYVIIELYATVFKRFFFIYIDSFHHPIGILVLRERNGDTDVKQLFKGHRARKSNKHG